MTIDEKRSIELSEKVKKLRKSKGKDKTQAWLAERIGASQPSISDIEGCKRNPNALTVAAIAKEFGVSSDYLLGLTKVATTDIDVKNACKYTGLSESAIETIHESSVMDRDKFILKFINDLLEYPLLWSMAIQYQNVKDRLKLYDERDQSYKARSEFQSSELGKSLEAEFYETAQDIAASSSLFTPEAHEKDLRDNLDFQEFLLQRHILKFLEYIETHK